MEPPESELPPGKIIARVAAGAALTMSAGHASASLDKFAAWFLAAFGAALALILSNLKDASVFISTDAVASAAYLFLAASVVCVAQRYVAMVIASGAASAKEGSEMGEKLEHMDSEEFISQLLQGMPWFARRMCRGTFEAMSKGDYAVGGRLFMRLAFLHGGLVTIELVVLLVAVAKIVNEIKA